MKLPLFRPRLSLKEEAQIRREFFTLHISPLQICQKWNIRTARLRRIVGGPLNPRRQSTAVEHYHPR